MRMSIRYLHIIIFRGTISVNRLHEQSALVDVTSIKRINYNGVPCFLVNGSVASAFV